jgi:class 3 adenylate cyclase
VPLPPPAHGPARTTTPAPPERVADFLGTRSDLPGERKHVSVLFADVTASMAVLTSHDAEEAAALFDQVVESMQMRYWLDRLVLERVSPI